MPPAAAAGQHGDERRSLTAPTASGPSSLRSLTWSWSGENGIASRSSAPAAATSRSAACAKSTSSSTFASRVSASSRSEPTTVDGGLADAVVVEDHEVRPRLARPLDQPAAARGLDHVDAVAEREPGHRARVRVDAAEQHARPPRGGRRVAHPLDRRRPPSGRPTAPSGPLASRAVRGGEVSASGPAASITARAALIRSPQDWEAAVGRLVQRLGDHRVEPAGQLRPQARRASAAPRTGARR